MIKLLKSLYRSLPVIKELNAIKDRLGCLPSHYRVMEAANMLQALELSLIHI